jgi:hypothetical protein
METIIEFADLPQAARDQISKRQQSYIDEFRFVKYPHHRIAAIYAGDILSVWDLFNPDAGWQEPIVAGVSRRL